MKATAATNPRVQPRDDHHVSESGQRESVAQTALDIASIADDQGAHLGALGEVEIGVDKGADPARSSPTCPETDGRRKPVRSIGRGATPARWR